MLKQLSRLSLEAEGRYASTKELQFIKSYRSSLELRLSTYQKIRNEEMAVVNLVIQRSHLKNPQLFQLDSEDFKPRCQRDIQLVLKASALAMLTDDLERLRNNLLLWQKTVVKALDHQHYIQVVYKVLPEVVSEILTPEETKLILPALKLSFNILAC